MLGGIAAVVAAGCGSGNETTESAAQDGCPYWSPDGRLLAFVRGNDQSDVYVVGGDGLRPRRLTRTSASEEVLGWRSRDEIVVRRAKGIYSIDLTGRRRGTIFRLPNDAYADLSPHADRLAIRVPMDDLRYRRVIVVELPTGRRRLLPKTYATGLTWSANGERLTYGRRDLVMQLVTISGEVLGSVRQTVTALPSPDGTQVAYDALGKVFVWSARSRRIRALVAAQETEPLAWSPDGHSIFYGVGPVGVVDVRTRRTRVVARFRDGNFVQCLAVSPDGRRLAFPRAIPGYTFGPPEDVSLMVMNRDGTGRRYVPKR